MRELGGKLSEPHFDSQLYNSDTPLFPLETIEILKKHCIYNIYNYIYYIYNNKFINQDSPCAPQEAHTFHLEKRSLISKKFINLSSIKELQNEDSMKQKPNSKHKLFNLDEDAINNLEEGAKLNDMNNSQFVEFLINSWDSSIDPSKKLKDLKKDKKLLKEKISEIERQEEKLIEILEKKNEWNQNRQKNKPLIIRNLMRVIESGRYNDAEKIAKNQAISLGIPAIELLTEANTKLGVGA